MTRPHDCPDCGDTPVVNLTLTPTGYGYRCQCLTCGRSGQDGYDTAEDAAQAWNSQIDDAGQLG